MEVYQQFIYQNRSLKLRLYILTATLKKNTFTHFSTVAKATTIF